MGLIKGPGSGALRGVLLLLALVGVVWVAGSQPEGASAVGEGIFQLDKTEYETLEGQAFLVTVQRTEGGTLTNDVQVILDVIGNTDTDFPASEETKLITFPKGTNLSSQSVYVQTLNKEQYTSRSIQVQILSVSNGGFVGARSTAPARLRGIGEPEVKGVSPRSGGSFFAEGTVLMLTGVNFISSNPLNSAIDKVQFLPVLGGGPQGGELPAVDYLQGPPPNPTTAFLKVPYLVDELPPGPPHSPLTDYADPALIGDPLRLEKATYYVQVHVNQETTGLIFSQATQANRFTYTTGATVTQVSVKQGPPTGGTQVVVSGTKFGVFPGAGAPCALGLVTVGGLPPQACSWLGPDQLRVTTPARSSGLVHIIVNDSPPTDDSRFNYQGLPVITGLTPNFGPQTGGTSVTIHGSNFIVGGQGPTSVLFGGNPSSFVVINDNQITATAPPGSGVQQVRIVHPVSGTSEFRTEANFVYSSGPLISNVSPANGPATGGTIVTITGTGFVPGAAVKFGDVQAFATVLSATSISVTAPPGSGIVDITVNVNGTVSPVGGQTKYSYDGPTVTSVTPIAGPLQGGTFITIKGTNFTTASVVHIGAAVVPSVFIDPNTLTATTPAVGAPVAAHVRVTTSSGQSPQVPEDVFTYTNGPIVDIVNPDTGPTLGGSIVVITGKNFSAPLSISFGDTPATSFNINSATQLTVLSPSTGTAGPVDVRVIKGTDISPVGPKTKFTYVSATPKVTALTPNQGSTFGGNEVTISGLGFTGAVCPGSVKFGTMVAASCTVVNDTTLITVAPPNVSGAAVVVVQTVNGTSDIVPNYTYISPSGPGGGTAPPAPPPGGTTTYNLSARWTLLTWAGPSGVMVSDAVRGTGISGGSDLSARISAIYLWDPAVAAYKAYFTGAESIPGASDFSQFTQGAVYWVAIMGTGQVPWVVPGP